MKRALQIIKRKRNARWLMAAAFFLILFVDLSSHAMTAIEDRHGSRPLTWCSIMHHNSPAADCPHKRSPFGPQKSFTDEVTHHWVLLGDLTVPVRGIVYTSAPIARRPAQDISRPTKPPFLPPKHA